MHDEKTKHARIIIISINYFFEFLVYDEGSALSADSKFKRASDALIVYPSIAILTVIQHFGAALQDWMSKSLNHITILILLFLFYGD
jgi:hypothetical protein